MVLYAQQVAVRQNHKYLSHSTAGKVFEKGSSLEKNMTRTMDPQQISQLKGKQGTTSSHWPCLLHLQQAHTLNSANAGGVAVGQFVRFHMFPSHLAECNDGAFSSNRPTQLYEKSQLSLSFMSNHSFPGLLGICLCVRGISQVVVHWLIPGWPSKVEVFQWHAIFPQLCVQAESR